jgi:hypothetical protein
LAGTGDGASGGKVAPHPLTLENDPPEPVENTPSKKQSFTKPFDRAAIEPGSPIIIVPTDRVGSPFSVPAFGRNSQQPPWILIGCPVMCSTCFGVIPKVGYAPDGDVDVERVDVSAPASLAEVVTDLAPELLDERVTNTAARIAPITTTPIAPAASRRRLRGPNPSTVCSIVRTPRK